MPSHCGSQTLTLLAAVASLITPTYGAFPLTSDSNCGCYKTNATKSNYFGHHKFWDFRSLHEYAMVPPPLDTFEGNEKADATSPFFGGGQPWAATWAIQNWNNTELLRLENSYVNDATVKMVNSFNNIYIESSHNETAGRDHNATGPWSNGTAPWNNGTASPGLTFMTMRTVRHDNFQSSAEFESRSAGYQFLSIRMYARTKGARGAVTAMFTYRAPPTPHNMALVQEADLEIRTNDPPTYVSYTNQPAWNSTGDIPEATRNVSLPSGRRWSDWAHYRMDWTPGSTTWFVNGQQHSTISFQAPRDPAHVMFNSWSDGGSWSGHMRPREEAYLQIQWIEIVYNNTDTGRERPGKCVNVCSIDETTELGTPVLITGDCKLPFLHPWQSLLTTRSQPKINSPFLSPLFHSNQDLRQYREGLRPAGLRRPRQPGRSPSLPRPSRRHRRQRRRHSLGHRHRRPLDRQRAWGVARPRSTTSATARTGGGAKSACRGRRASFKTTTIRNVSEGQTVHWWPCCFGPWVVVGRPVSGARTPPAGWGRF